MALRSRLAVLALARCRRRHGGLRASARPTCSAGRPPSAGPRSSSPSSPTTSTAGSCATEAALSLIRMRPRGGSASGHRVPGRSSYKDEDGESRDGALASCSRGRAPADRRRHGAELIKEIQQPPPPRTAEGRRPARSRRIPFKDAAFAMLVHEPPLVTNEKTRKATSSAALTQWAQTDFEDRIENGSQQFGLEQMMRFLGAPSVKTLPSIINENSTQDRPHRRPHQRRRRRRHEAQGAREALVALAKQIDSKDWLDEQTHARRGVERAQQHQGRRRRRSPVRSSKYPGAELTEEVFPAMKQRRRPPVDRLPLHVRAPTRRQHRRAPQARARRARGPRRQEQPDATSSASSRSPRDDDTPGRGSRRRVPAHGRAPEGADRPEALHALRAEEVEGPLGRGATRPQDDDSTKQIPEFMQHLPKTAATKMGMTEPISYGARSSQDGAAAGRAEAARRHHPVPASEELGAKLTALGFF